MPTRAFSRPFAPASLCLPSTARAWPFCLCGKRIADVKVWVQRLLPGHAHQQVRRRRKRRPRPPAARRTLLEAATDNRPFSPLYIPPSWLRLVGATKAPHAALASVERCRCAPEMTYPMTQKRQREKSLNIKTTKRLLGEIRGYR